jgi:hypothetical protein
MEDGADSMSRLWPQRVNTSAGVPELRATDHCGAGHGRLQLDLGHRAGDHRSNHFDVGPVNVTVIVAGIGAYGVLKLLSVFGLLHPLLRNYGTDLLAMPVLLAFANLLTLRSPFANVFARPIAAVGLTAAAAVVWEVIAPMYVTSTADLADCVAYAAGTCAYLVFICATRLSFRQAACRTSRRA